MRKNPSMRQLLLGLGLLSVCAAGPAPSTTIDPVTPATPSAVGPVVERPARIVRHNGAAGAYLNARYAASQADPDRAAGSYLRALEADPSQPELLQGAFVASLLSGRPEAVTLARRLPANQEAQYLLAGVDARAGKWDSAQQRFSSMPRQGLTQLLQPLLVAWAQQGAGKTDAALATLRPYADGKTFRGIYVLHMALIADQAGRTADAEKSYALARTLFAPNNLRLAQIMASWDVRQGRPDAAKQLLQGLSDGQDEMALIVPELIAHDAARPVNTPLQGIADSYLALAAALQQQDANDFALIMLRLALDLRPDFTEARILSAEINMSGKHYAQATQALAAIPVSDPLTPMVRMQRARILDQLGKTDAALAELNEISKTYPGSPLPEIQKGDILRGKKRFADAIVAYDAAIARINAPRRSTWPLFFSRGVAHERAGQWPLAEADMKRALELAPDQPSVLNYLGYSWADQGIRLPEARKMIERAIEQQPKDPAIIDSLGWVMFRQGQPGDAELLLEQAVSLQPEDPTINAHLGEAYWAVGRRLEAVFQWRRALTLDPDPDDKARWEARLRDIDSEQLTPTPVRTP
jgi:tetratricopeptide (TPR) repeat protein